MNSHNLSKPSTTMVLAAVIAFVTVAVRLGYGPRTVDDAFITFRYARNIAEGVGFVFNPGERILGTTTPLFALLLAAFYRIGSQLPWSALLIASLADAGTAVLIFLVISRVSRSTLAALVAALLFSVSAGSIRFTGGGMETGLFVFLVMLATWLFIDERYSLAAVSAALATLTRPEGIIVLCVLGSLFLVRFRKLPWFIIGISLAIGLPWVVFAFAYFGSPLPYSMVAKGSTYAFPPLTALKSLLGYLVAYTLPTDDLELGRLFKYGFAILVLFLGALTAIVYGKRRGEDYSVLWAFPAVYLGVYTIANPPVWEWYALPLVPFTVCLLVSGGVEVWRTAVTRMRIGNLHALGFLKFLVLPAICLLGLVQIQQILRIDVRVGRELTYADIAHKLQPLLQHEDNLAAPEIGALGYLLPSAYMLDTQGLVSPAAVPYRQDVLRTLSLDVDFQALWFASGAIPPSLIAEQKPQYVVSPEKLAALLVRDEVFSEAYRLILTEPSDFMGGSGILVWQRVDGGN